MVEARSSDADSAMGESRPGLPAGTLTFVMTDVEGSSRLWEAAPGAASVVLARRQEIISDSTWRHGGALPVEQGEGDSSVSVFARASDAAACALDVQRRLGEERWPAGAELRVRIALHTGEAELRRDGTYEGAALNRCARLRSIGHGGQILVSQATYEVLVDGIADGVALRDLGVHRLRDLARPEHVWQLSHPELADAFPPLRSLDAVTNNLPVQLTSFVGRDTQIDEVSTLVSERRLVTLIGAGGCGKTRFALAVAANVADEYTDGICWVDLAPLSDPSLVPAALAGVLGVRESPVEPITDTVVGYLATRRALVGLDNCEHLIEACAALAARLMEGCAGVTVLATSRELLGVAGETTWAVPPLTVPQDDAVASCEAVRLFVDRARSSRPNFALTDDNVPAVAEICTRLDGIPLAIELAAARARVVTVDQIAEGLADRFHLLTGGGRSALPRQRTLESSVDWSHDLLDAAERAVFRRLAVFAGSFTLNGAEAVCASEEIAPPQVLDLLCTLVDRSLVQVVDNVGAQTRYRLLETIRDYARHKLTDAGEAEATRDRHLDCYVAFCERASPGLGGPALLAWLSRVDADVDNLRAAPDWSTDSADPDRGPRVVGLLNLYWFARSDLTIGRARLEATLDNARRDGLDRADALSALCIVCYRAGDMAKAGGYGDEAIAIGRRRGDACTLGRALHWRAWVRFWGEADRWGAWSDFEEASALLRQTDDRVFRALNLALAGLSYASTSEAPRARALLDEGLALTGVADAPHARCYCLVVLGYLDMFEGSLDSAAVHLDEALVLADEIGDHYAEILARMFLAYVDVFRGRYRDARELCEPGVAAALEHRSPNGEAFMRLALGNVDFAEGHLDAAAAELERSFELFHLLMPAIAAVSRAAQAHVALARSCPDEAHEYAAEALDLGRQTDTIFATAQALSAQASLARLDGDAHRAEDLLHDALDLAHQVAFRTFVCEILDILGTVVADQGRFEEAARLLGAAHSARDAIGYRQLPAHQPSHEADLAVVRDALGAEAFDDAWTDGAALSLDDAVVYARRGRGQRKRPTHGWHSLTPTELQVVELVAEGLTNPQIGQRLFISPRTVQSHLYHTFAKLGVSTRAELAATTAQRRAVNHT